MDGKEMDGKEMDGKENPPPSLANLARVLKDSAWTKNNGENNTKHVPSKLVPVASLATFGAFFAFLAGAAFCLPEPTDGKEMDGKETDGKEMDGKETDGKENPPPSFFAFLLAKLFVFGACWTIALLLV